MLRPAWLAPLLACASALTQAPRCAPIALRGAWAPRAAVLRCAEAGEVTSWYDSGVRLSTEAAAAKPAKSAPTDLEAQIPEEVAAQIPPEKLAAAWKRDEDATELATLLKGCPLYLVGLSARKAAVGRALARRLKTYRLLDAPALMLSTYKALSGGETAVSMQQLMASEPVDDVRQLSTAVMREVQQYTRSVVVTWDGAVERADYMVMQQGIVANVEFEVDADDVALPPEGGAELLEQWKEGHSGADVTVPIGEGVAPDDAAALLIARLSSFIKANPGRSEQWKQDADAKLAAKDGES